MPGRQQRGAQLQPQPLFARLHDCFGRKRATISSSVVGGGLLYIAQPCVGSSRRATNFHKQAGLIVDLHPHETAHSHTPRQCFTSCSTN
ncbi:hypothetical protein BU23DRAFT_308696 [Bimuria novae-zelandiae CBS 107.79]|uniref:Uncharacterized protein n=1 Tax=Bimuria novae-zelandiae CBS 107.79 TaxID=1447943 RepID=A0A6A5UQQ3_9PLEO|nr:hypothetical protein BU23DRAFT_308696 [Bimuria novae-zelandiae CBS 107.79]